MATIQIRQKIDTDRESQIAWSDEESVHTEWSESNVWTDEVDDGIDKGIKIIKRPRTSTRPQDVSTPPPSLKQKTI